MKYMRCDKCGSEEMVNSITFKYKENSAFSRDVKHTVKRDLCRACIKKTISFIYAKDGE